MPHQAEQDHLSAGCLAAFEGGSLPEESVSAVEAHLAECSSCCESLLKLPADGFLTRLRHAYQAAPTQAGYVLSPTPLPAATAAFASLPGESSPPTDEVPNLPGFLDLREQGRGGMGVVYAATHALMGRRVAIKVIHREFASHPAAASRFQREVHAVARLAHPNIVTAHDAGQCGDRLFLVMEYVDGESLADRLRRHGPLPVVEACDALHQAAVGVQHAHDNGLVHRDLKPHNLMRTADGGIKVCDFGLAALADERGRRAGATAPHAIMGTPAYMAPEQAEDARHADGRADVYSLGCTLYHLLTGKAPFAEESTLLQLLAHRTEDRPSARRRRPEVAPELDAVVRKAMARRPEDRYPTPGALAEALAPFTDAAPARPSARRWRWAPALLAALAFLTAAAAGVIRFPVGKDRDLVVETDDPRIEIIARGDRIARIVDPETGKAYHLDRKELTLSLADDPDGLTVDLDGRRPVVLRRQGKRIAVVRLEPKQRANKPRRSEPLFNGADLAGWVVEGPEVWEVQDGEIVGRGVSAGSGYPRSGHLLSEQSYTDFLLRFEYRLSAGGNSGVALRAVPGETDTETKSVPEHLEVQIRDDGEQPRLTNHPTGSLFWTTDHSYLQPDRLADLEPAGSWNEMTIEYRGSQLQVWVRAYALRLA